MLNALIRHSLITLLISELMQALCNPIDKYGPTAFVKQALVVSVRR